MKTTFLSTLVIPTLIAVAGIAYASDDNQTGMEASYLTQTPQGTFHSDSLTGNQVKSSVEDDEDIGTINDLIIDEDGQINAVVVGVGGFLGMGEKDVAIEWDSLELTKDEDGEDYIISVNASQEALESAEEYERGNDLHTERDTEMNNSENDDE
ncbi:PRC-barrel domain-containing protein [Vreelandella alkaliphila]|uniref:PRC-barrel domain-containing protein n=1 Tax=Vreelandella alkaliphila TaxID=272774 RepID=A0AAJ2VPW4_9GAMM|nr:MULTISPECIES: PRC-barrel domain-containing protein [Halomonas]AYF32502.1 photosystem reaction center subunit H [Halomonas alkaliphila]MDX5978927.1 PRC-barrel domain-containing protein [Halomonas alkaliphila]PAU73329.1 photosystem reaction center subunit H [Halomonas humidisoli]